MADITSHVVSTESSQSWASQIIEDEQVSAAPLADSTDYHPESLFRVLSLLCAHGVFERVDGRFQHSELSRIIRSDHPASMRAFARMFGIPLSGSLSIRLNDSRSHRDQPMGNDVTEVGFWRYFRRSSRRKRKVQQHYGGKSRRSFVPLVIAAYTTSNLYLRIM